MSSDPVVTVEHSPGAPAGRKVPGPTSPAIVQTLRLLRSPDRFLADLQARYGKAVNVRLLGFGDTIWLADPAAVKAAYADPETLQSGAASAPLLGPMVGPASVLTLDGAEHLRQRKLLLPAFHGEAVRSYERVIDELAAAELARWAVGDRFALKPAMQRLTMEVILTAVFGMPDGRERERMRAAIAPIMRLGWIVGLGPWIRRDLGPLSPWGHFVRRRDAADALIHEQIALRRGTEPGDDILSLLLQAVDESGRPMSDAELRDELMTLLLAGHDTTANSLAWCMDLVLRAPHVERRLVEEARTGGHAYADAVVKETLRLRPVVPFSARLAACDVEIAGYRIPARTRLWQPALLLQRDPANFPEPLRFLPDRWLEGKPPPFTWLPFGGGVRRCIGAAFAQLEMRVVLQHILLHARLSLTDDRPERPVLNNVVVVPRRGVRVRLDGWRADPRDGPLPA